MDKALDKHFVDWDYEEKLLGTPVGLAASTVMGEIKDGDLTTFAELFSVMSLYAEDGPLAGEHHCSERETAQAIMFQLSKHHGMHIAKMLNQIDNKLGMVLKLVPDSEAKKWAHTSAGRFDTFIKFNEVGVFLLENGALNFGGHLSAVVSACEKFDRSESWVKKEWAKFNAHWDKVIDDLDESQTKNAEEKVANGRQLTPMEVPNRSKLVKLFDIRSRYKPSVK